MDTFFDLSLVDGPLLWFSLAAGVIGAVHLLWRRKLSWALFVAGALLAAVAIVALVHWLLIYVFSAFPEHLPIEILAWSVPAVAAVLLFALRLRRNTWPGRAASALAMLGVVLLSAVQINIYFGLNNTVADLAGTAVARIQPLEDSLKKQPGSPVRPAPAAWTAPDSMPSGGILRRAEIPGTISGFTSREAFVYLPPAYQTAARPALPVLVLFSGQPGGPSDWLSGGRLRAVLDKFAANHGGLAPVTVVVDPNGSGSANTMCMDSRIAQADTYLSQDVPAWIRATLDTNPDSSQWGVGGFSFGATCAVQMGTRHPATYPSVLAFSAEQEPALAKDRSKTIAESFGGDVAAFESLTPLAVMGQRQYPGSAVYFAAGATDHEFIGYMEVLAKAARSAGFTVEEHSIARAGHSWDTVVKGMPEALDFLGGRWGIPK
ncbi:esterase family protein [Arthrobacter sp. CJ23]|uniref:alpha/beta hydrolase n=1 Tax=Arthrobacter sp. CJ23 TaxID=2972479 RepID=UPI00215C2002|nr:esterase family protein [Arthrobacter sp. CJ23]UVJ38228.1 esterase family protein [Arthrobacter sp. CJ23]